VEGSKTRDVASLQLFQEVFKWTALESRCRLQAEAREQTNSWAVGMILSLVRELIA